MKIRYVWPLLLVSALAWGQTAARQHLKSKLAQERHLTWTINLRRATDRWLISDVEAR